MTAIGTDIDRLHEIARIAALLESHRVHDEALALASRVAEGQFYVACVGQFKRGKSTLIDALLNDAVLPAGVVPVTAVPTVVRYGAVRGARVRIGAPSGAGSPHADWRTIPPEDLELYVSEEHNPENAKRVLGIEVFTPSPLLASGMCLIDTPGLGSVFENNTSATLAFVPQIDAAIVVIGADPPLTGDELDLIADISRHVSDLLFVLNKADRVTDNEREQATAFARTVVERRLGRRIDHVFQISATDRLAHVGPPRDWNQFIEALESLVARAGTRLARKSGQRGILRLVEQLLEATRALRAALLRPVEENEQHLRAVESVVGDGERAVSDLSALFSAERDRLAHRFATERGAFVAASLPDARSALAAHVTATPRRFGPGLRRHLLHAAQDIARDALDPWLTTQQQVAEAVYRAAMSRFIEGAHAILDQLAKSGVPLGVLQADLAGMEAGFRTRSTFAFNEIIHVAEPASPLRFLSDVFLGLVARWAIERDAHAFLEWLVEVNSTRVESDVAQRIAESQRALERDLRSLLTAAQASARRVLEHANAVRATGQIGVTEELHRLDEIDRKLVEVSDRR